MNHDQCNSFSSTENSKEREEGNTQITNGIILNTNNYKDSIITSGNLGEDTDTIGAITGSISGLLYGLDYIPVEWKIYLKKSIYLMDIAKKFEKVLKSNFC